MKHAQQRVAMAQARFFAYHGVYPQEQIIGTPFVVDIEVMFDRELQVAAEEDLDRTVNYAELYDIARDEMAKPRKLLETVTETILLSVRTQFPFVNHIRVCITKQNPPFGGDVAQARVALEWEKES